MLDRKTNVQMASTWNRVRANSYLGYSQNKKSGLVASTVDKVS